MVIEREGVGLSEMIESDTCSNNTSTNQCGLLSGCFPTADGRNENGHLNSARNAGGVRCSVLRPPATESACKCYTLPPSTRKRRNDASGLLPRLRGCKQTHKQHRLKYSPFCLMNKSECIRTFFRTRCCYLLLNQTCKSNNVWL